MFNILQKVCALLDRDEQKMALFLFALMVGVGLIEVVGVASILPLIAVLSNPGLVQTNWILKPIYSWLNFSDVNHFLIFLSLIVFLMTVIRAFSTMVLNYMTLRFAHNRVSKWSTKLFSDYLRRPYIWFTKQHSAELAKSILFEADQVVQGCLLPALSLTSQILVSLFILALILMVEPLVTGIVTAVVGGVYLLIYIFIRRRLVLIGQDRLELHGSRYRLAQETIGGIKEVKVSGSEVSYENRFRIASEALSDRTQQLQVIREFPKSLLEVTAIGGILLFILVLLGREGSDFTKVMPIVGLYTFAGLRLMPSINRIFQDFAYLKSYEKLLDKFSRDLKEGFDREREGDRVLRFNEKIELSNVCFSFPDAGSTLSHIHLVITTGSIVGIVGPTGAGKSTLIDLILGLLKPQSGQVLIDDEILDATNTRAWHKLIGYVPQHIFLFDDTIAANIAMGVSFEEIDFSAVERAARAAKVHEFVMAELPDGYATKIGDRGIRLSGGQRQRIGIARALYRNPSVIILDEATSALDSLTEQAVIEGLRDADGVKTILHITHRLATVRVCDSIIFLEKGKISAIGSYDYLVRNCFSFREFSSSTSDASPSKS